MFDDVTGEGGDGTARVDGVYVETAGLGAVDITGGREETGGAAGASSHAPAGALVAAAVLGLIGTAAPTVGRGALGTAGFGADTAAVGLDEND